MEYEMSPMPGEQAFEELQSLDRSKGPAGSPRPGAQRLDQAAEGNDNLLARELSDEDAQAALHPEEAPAAPAAPPPLAQAEPPQVIVEPLRDQMWDREATKELPEQPMGTTDVPPIPMDRTEQLAQARMTGEGAPPPEV